MQEAADSASALPLSARARALLRRLGAMTYDGLVLVALLICLTVPNVIARGGAVPAGDLPYRMAVLAIPVAFYLLFWTWRGQTVGMRAWQLTVVGKDGGRVPLGAAALRWAASLLSLGCLGLGYLWILVDPRGLGWHDHLSGTRIVFRPAPAPRAGAPSSGH